MRLNGDPYWEHDDECSLDNPCSYHLREEEDRAHDSEMDRMVEGSVPGLGRVEGEGGGSNPPSPPACKQCGQVRAGTPWRAAPYLRASGEGLTLVWLCKPCVEEGA